MQRMILPGCPVLAPRGIPTKMLLFNVKRIEHTSSSARICLTHQDGLCDDDSEQMAWVAPQYARKEVDRAGSVLVSQLHSQGQWEALSSLRDAYGIISNWRSSHSYPLQALTMNLRQRAASVDQTALIAQRLKRISSIDAKLRDKPNMKLSQMQDIGGCRAVVKDIHCLDALVAKFERGRHQCWEFNKKFDYVKEPKRDGYRSVHLVYKYSNPSIERSMYNKLRIEVQLRTQLQHTWATALETVDAFTRQALKANRGRPDWARFFVLTGHSISSREGRNGVPGAPSDRHELIKELKQLCHSLNVIPTLLGWTKAIQITEDPSRKGHFYLLRLDFNSRRMNVLAFPKRDAARAAEEYSSAEEDYRNREDMLTVLVSVDSMDALRAAYPNYYLDTSLFVKLVQEDIDCVS